MRGQIRKRGNSYVAIIYKGKDFQGKKRYQWISCRTKREAQAKLAQLVHEHDIGIYADPKGTLGEFATRWLVEYAVPNLAPRTTEGYQSIIRAHVMTKLGQIPLKDLKPEHLQKYYANLLAGGLTTTTAAHHAALLHRILEHAMRWQLLARNPADGVSPPRARHIEMHTLDEAQAEKILEEAKSTPYFYIYHLALFSGLRQSELLALRWCDIDLVMAEISVSRTMHRLLTHEIIFRTTKTPKSRRTVALSPKACTTLRQHLDIEKSQCVRLGIEFTDDRLIFCQWDGAPLKPLSISQAWRRLTSRLGIENIRFHDLRHTHATLMLQQGVHPKIVQERLGHSTISVTLDRYSHVTPGIQRKAADAFDEIMTPQNSKRIANAINET